MKKFLLNTSVAILAIAAIVMSLMTAARAQGWQYNEKHDKYIKVVSVQDFVSDGFKEGFSKDYFSTYWTDDVWYVVKDTIANL